MLQLGFSLLSISGHYVDVGLVGDRIDIPLFPRVSREQTFHGSFWGNNTDLSEVRSEEHTSELQPLMRISYAVFCLKTKNRQFPTHNTTRQTHDHNLHPQQMG